MSPLGPRLGENPGLSGVFNAHLAPAMVKIQAAAGFWVMQVMHIVASLSIASRLSTFVRRHGRWVCARRGAGVVCGLLPAKRGLCTTCHAGVYGIGVWHWPRGGVPAIPRRRLLLASAAAGDIPFRSNGAASSAEGSALNVLSTMRGIGRRHGLIDLLVAVRCIEAHGIVDPAWAASWRQSLGAGMYHRSNLRSHLQLVRTVPQAVVNPVGSNGAARSAEGSDVVVHHLFATSGRGLVTYLFSAAFCGMLYVL